MVETFMRSFGQATPETPTLKDYPFVLRSRLVAEEAGEFREACETGLHGHPPTKVMVEMIDAMCDILYVTYGAACAMGIDLTPYFAEVHRTNMAKLGPDGKPILREDGKGLKPPGWEPPDLAGILAKELAQ